MATTYDDLREDGYYDLDVRVREVTQPKVENRAVELSVEDRDGKRFQCVIWTASETGRSYPWKEGSWYRLSGAIVNEWPSGKVLHGTSSLEIQRLDGPPGEERSEVVYMTDSHLGKTQHHFGGESWTVDPARGFESATDYAIERDVDAVIHGGDLFHNPGSGIADTDVAIAREVLRSVAEAEIPFYFIYGNHEREAGRRVLERFTDDGLAVHLGPRYESVGENLAIYGVDNQSGWDDYVLDFDTPPDEMVTMLCVHQSLAPFTASSSPEGSMTELRKRANVAFDVVVTGHTHIRETEWHPEGLQMAGGATTRVGETQDALDPSVERIAVEDGEPTTNQVTL